jgi:hypothetical protein
MEGGKAMPIRPPQIRANLQGGKILFSLIAQLDAKPVDPQFMLITTSLLHRQLSNVLHDDQVHISRSFQNDMRKILVIHMHNMTVVHFEDVMANL